MEHLPPLTAKLGGAGVIKGSGRKSFVTAYLEAGDSLGSVGAGVVIHASLVADSNSSLVGYGANSNFEASMGMLGPVLGSSGTKFGMSEGGGSCIFLVESCLLEVLKVDGSHCG